MWDNVLKFRTMYRGKGVYYCDAYIALIGMKHCNRIPDLPMSMSQRSDGINFKALPTRSVNYPWSVT